MAKSFDTKIKALLATLATLGAGVAGFWTQIQDIINPPVETEVVAPTSTSSVIKNVELNGSGTANGGGDASGSVSINDLNF